MTDLPSTSTGKPTTTASLGRLRVLLPVAVAALSAGFAWLAASEYLRAAEARIARQYTEQHRTREVIVAARRLEAGAVLDAEMLARRTVPVRYAPKSALGPERLAELLGRELAQPLDPGDTLVPAVLRDSGATALATLLAHGERALTIAIDDTNSHAGLLRPGDVVDLLFVSVEDGSARQSARVRPLLQAVRVLATGRSLPPAASRGSAETGIVRDFATITLRVSARDAERIALADRAGELLVSLRAPGDFETTTHAPLELGSLLAADMREGRNPPATQRHGPNGGKWYVDGWVGGHDGPLQPHRWYPPAATGAMLR